MRSIARVAALCCVVGVAGSVISAQAQKVYVADNGTRSVNSGWNVKAFNNGAHAYIIGDNEGVTFSPRGVALDSTGGIYVMHLSPKGPNLHSIDKYSENADGTASKSPAMAALDCLARVTGELVISEELTSPLLMTRFMALTQVVRGTPPAGEATTHPVVGVQAHTVTLQDGRAQVGR